VCYAGGFTHAPQADRWSHTDMGDNRDPGHSKIVRSCHSSQFLPQRLEDEYKKTGFVNQWRLGSRNVQDTKAERERNWERSNSFPVRSDVLCGSTRASTRSLDTDRQRLAPFSERERTLRYWAIMKKWMGKKDFLPPEASRETRL